MGHCIPQWNLIWVKDPGLTICHAKKISLYNNLYKLYLRPPSRAGVSERLTILPTSPLFIQLRSTHIHKRSLEFNKGQMGVKNQNVKKVNTMGMIIKFKVKVKVIIIIAIAP